MDKSQNILGLSQISFTDSLIQGNCHRAMMVSLTDSLTSQNFTLVKVKTEQ